jgi:Family of unknown function (DUF6074)
MNQLDLFADAAKVVQPSAHISPFPLSRRRTLIVRAATNLISRKTQNGREKYWGRLVHDLARELRRYGASAAEVEAQLLAFHQAVGHEVIGYEPHPMSPNGAA